MKKTFLILFVFILSSSAWGQMGGNVCLFKIFIGNNKVLMPEDTTSFSLYNIHTDFKELKYKEATICPDSCWSLCSDGGSYTGGYPGGHYWEEDVVFHPFLVIIKKTTNDTMRVHYNYVVYGEESKSPWPKIINEIVFIPGNFEVYEHTNRKDWLNYSNSNKIKKAVKGSLYLTYWNYFYHSYVKMPVTPYYNLIGVITEFDAISDFKSFQRIVDSLQLKIYKTIDDGIILQSKTNVLKANYPKLLKIVAKIRGVACCGPIYQMVENNFSIISNYLDVQFEKNMPISEIDQYLKKFGLKNYYGPGEDNIYHLGFSSYIGYGICAKIDEMYKTGKIISLGVSICTPQGLD